MYMYICAYTHSDYDSVSRPTGLPWNWPAAYAFSSHGTNATTRTRCRLSSCSQGWHSERASTPLLNSA